MGAVGRRLRGWRPASAAATADGFAARMARGRWQRPPPWQQAQPWQPYPPSAPLLRLRARRRQVARTRAGNHHRRQRRSSCPPPPPPPAGARAATTTTTAASDPRQACNTLTSVNGAARRGRSRPGHVLHAPRTRSRTGSPGAAWRRAATARPAPTGRVADADLLASRNAPRRSRCSVLLFSGNVGTALGRHEGCTRLQHTGRTPRTR